MINTKKLFTAKKYIYLFLLTVLSACTGQRISEEAFSSNTWRQDKKGCNGERLEIKEEFDTIKEQLIGLSETETRNFLGAPDKVQLFERNQKFYIYYLEPGAQCEGKEGKEGKSYHIRFNSINQVNEISLVLPSL
ncbi:hypothetical protein [Chondrinema litorale]|uniref:hypothetical protein n=1 Tax=Chondrinema litorale TaxID=2994555 RepID=UPI00254300BA|nr:hypothetical protein [Chondrinema litorale]UZR95123.1 hypothetical protein OQ292_04740 [Chondrinema litorale]